MANIKSQKKRILQNAAAGERNKAVRSALKTKVRRFVEQGLISFLITPADFSGGDFFMWLFVASRKIRER